VTGHNFPWLAMHKAGLSLTYVLDFEGCHMSCHMDMVKHAVAFDGVGNLGRSGRTENNSAFMVLDELADRTKKIWLN
jgi:hypothetical protein